MSEPSFLNEAVLIHDYRSRSVLDLSGNSNDGAMTSTVWTGNGLNFPAASVVTVTDSAELQGTEFTLVIFGEFLKQQTQYLISKWDAGGSNYRFYSTTSALRMTDGVGTSSLTTPIVGKKYLAASVANGGNVDFYVDGLLAGTPVQAITVATNDADVSIGNNYANSFPVTGNTVSGALIFPRVLTETEHAQLYGYLESLSFPTKTESREKNFRPDELVDGDMEASGVSAWTSSNSILTKETTNPKEGLQVLRITRDGGLPLAYQGVNTVGNLYRIKGYARGDGTRAPAIASSILIWSGTSSTDWQWFDVTYAAASANLVLRTVSNAVGYVEFDDVQCVDLAKAYSPLTYHTDWGVTESVANVTGGFLENSPFTRQSGTWKISTDTIDGKDVKVIECVVAGILTIPTSQFQQTPTESAYGTYEWHMYQKAGNTPIVNFISSVTTGVTTGYYMFVEPANQRVRFWEPGGAGELFSGTNSSVTAGTWNKFKVTRTSAGIFTVYMNDAVITAATGSNPVTDNTTTTSSYLLLDLDAGDKISYSALNGDSSIIKKLTS